MKRTRLNTQMMIQSIRRYSRILKKQLHLFRNTWVQDFRLNDRTHDDPTTSEMPRSDDFLLLFEQLSNSSRTSITA